MSSPRRTARLVAYACVALATAAIAVYHWLQFVTASASIATGHDERTAAQSHLDTCLIIGSSCMILAFCAAVRFIECYRSRA